MSIIFSHHLAMDKSRASSNGGAINCIPSGIPDSPRPDGRVIVGNPHEVHGPWNLVSPVFVRSANGAVGVDGVSRTSACSERISLSAVNRSRLS